MRRNTLCRYLPIILLCIACFVLYGCGGSSIHTPPSSGQGTSAVSGEGASTLSGEGLTAHEQEIAADRARIEELKEMALLMAYSGGAGMDANGDDAVGLGGYAVMAEGDVYYFAYTLHADSAKDTSEVSLLATLTDDELKRIEGFIRDKRLLVDSFEAEVIMDASWMLYVNSEGKHVSISNHIDLTNEAFDVIEALVDAES